MSPEHQLSKDFQNHAITAREYIDLADRDADVIWQQTGNVNKVVKLLDSNAYHILVSVGPTIWQAFGTTVDTQPHGSAGYADNAVETSIAVQDTFVVIAGTFVAGALSDFTVNAAGLLTYTGAATRHVHIVSNFDFVSATNNQIMQFQWFLKGAAYGYAVSRKAAVGADVGAVSVHADAMMSTGDTLQLRVRNRSGITNLTCGNVYLFAMGMG